VAFTDRLRQHPPFFWVAIAVGTAIFALYPFTVSVLVRKGGLETHVGWTAARDDDGRLRVAHVDAGGPADGSLNVGDIVLTVNGLANLPRELGWVLFMDVRPGNHYVVSVEQDGAPIEHELTASSRSNPQKVWLIQVPLLVISFCFFATGVGVALVSPRARVARLYAIAALAVAAQLIPGGVLLGDLLHGRDRLVLLAVASLIPFVYPVIYQFFAEFPPGVPQAIFWRRVKFILFAWAAAFFPVNALTNIAAAQGNPAAVTFIASHPTMFAISEGMRPLFLTSAVLATVAVIVRNYTAVDDPVRRSRLRWIIAGWVAAATPFTMLVATDLIAALGGVEFDYVTWLHLQTIAQLFLVVLPLTFTYAVLAHRVVGVEVVVRRGLRYVLARNVLRTAVFLPLLIIGISVLVNSHRTVAEILFQNPFLAGLALAAALALATRDRLERALDRRFFRDTSERDRLMLDLVHELARRDDVTGLTPLVVGRIERALQTTDVRLLLEDDPEFSAKADTLSAEALGSQLVVPIRSGGERVVGLLLLGEKKSEEPYSREDRRLVEAVAAQVAVVRENAALRRTAAHDARVKQEVLARLDTTTFNLLKECPTCGACYDNRDDTCTKDGQALSLSVPVDRTIDGRYRLEHLLGHGGMGRVYAATDVRLRRDVAVKVMRDAVLTNDVARRRFHREARACARLRHEHIVAVYDYGTTGHDVAYLVMERLVGTTLRAVLQRSGCLSPLQVADWVKQMLDGIGCAHEAGIIHRDLKPENVFLTQRDAGTTSITLLDFGVAKWRLTDSEESRSLTAPGRAVGTLAYMSPEQLLGMPVDASSDLYAIGVIVLEALTGDNPFQRRDPQATIAAILHEQASIGTADSATAALNAVLQRGIAKDRHQRFTCAHEMAAALLPALRSCPPPPPVRAAAGGADTTLTA
jgi:tRNA A-37 threonylcarbamoyl transferase component Bud32